MADSINRLCLTKDEVEKYLTYSPKTGIFHWKVWKSGWCDNDGRVWPGKVAGDVACHGYRRICVNYERRLAHHLAYLLMTGSFPPKNIQVDHINGDRSDNRWCNLRLVTNSENQMNSKRRYDNTSGFKGVSFCNVTGRWFAYINKNKLRYDLGRYDEIGDAIAARKSAELKMFGAYSTYARGI